MFRNVVGSRRKTRTFRMRRLAAFLAVLSALLVAGGPIASVVHYLLVPHAICEHGQLVEVSEPGRRNAPWWGANGNAPSVHTGHSALHSDSHDHCTITAVGQHIAIPSASLGAYIIQTIQSPWLGRAGQFICDRRQAILMLAPKTSPPLA
jgi:hypothetical protein